MEADQEGKQIEAYDLYKRIVFAFLLVLIVLTIPLILATIAQRTFNLSELTRHLSQSVLVSAFVVVGIWQLRKRLDQGKPVSIGIGDLKGALLKLLLGIGILAVPLILSLITTEIAGWAEIKINWQRAQPEMILLGMLSVFLTDALPEELVFRGYIFSNLSDKFSVRKSAIITTALFVIFPVILIPIQGLLGSLVTAGIVSSISGGYLAYLLFFGIFAVYLRILTNSIWTGVGFHLMFVYFNQLIGIENTNLIQFSEYTNELPSQLSLGFYLLLTFIALLVYPWIKSRKSSFKEKSVG